MPKKRNLDKRKGRLPGDDTTDAPPPKPTTEIRVGNISGVSGNVNVAGRDIMASYSTRYLSAAKTKTLFDRLYTHIDTRPELAKAYKEDLKVEVQEIHSALTRAEENKEEINEACLLRHLRNIGRMAPDVFDLMVAVLANPVTGLGIACSKIAEKAKTEFHMPGDTTTDVPLPASKKKKLKGK